jgi:uncharacterized protein (TIRG00374 family)
MTRDTESIALTNRAPSEIQPPEFSRRRLVAGLLLLSGLAVGGIALAMAGRGGLQAFRSVRPPDPFFLFVAFLIGAFDILIGGWRIHNLAHRLAPSVGLWDCLRAELANRCLAGITPWQTGGGGAQLYVLARAGLAIPGGVAVGTINFVISTVILIAFGFTALTLLERGALFRHDLPLWIRASTRWTLGLLIVFLIAAIAVVRIPDPGALRESDPGASRLRRAVRAARALVHNSLETVREMMRSHRLPVLGVFPITVGIFATKIAYTWAVFRAFQPEGHLGELLGVLMILILALLFAPTPGASGVAEGSATAFLAPALGAPASVGFVLYWRTLSLYLPVLLGGIVLLQQLGRDSRELTQKGASGEPGAGSRRRA